MPTKQEDKQQPAQKQQERQEQNAAIGSRVLHALGQPRNMHRIQVRRLWEHYYRVNVFVGADAVSAMITHSFFLAVDGEGNIITCSPAITKQY